MRTDFLAAILLFTSVPALAQEGSAPAASAPQQAVVPAPTLSLLRDTPVELMAPTEVRSDSAPPGTRFKLRVNKPVMADGVVVIPVGTTAFGEVIAAKSSSGLGKSGSMQMRLLHIQMGDVSIPLDGDATTRGDGAGSGGMAVLFGGVVGLFHRGNNAKIKAGELVNGFILTETRFDPVTKLPIANVQASPVAAPAANDPPKS